MSNNSINTSNKKNTNNKSMKENITNGKHQINDDIIDNKKTKTSNEGEHKIKRNVDNKQQKSKRKNIIRVLFLIISIAFLYITVKFYSSIINLNMLPNKYMIVFTIIECIVTIALVIGLAKKHKTFKLNIFCLIIVIIMSFVYIYANNYVNITKKFLNDVLTEVAEIEEYYIVVRKGDKYNSIEDINDKELCAFQIENDVRDKIEQKVKNSTLRFENTLTQLGNDLLDSKIDIIVISSSQYNILCEEIENFASETEIIYTEVHNIANEDSIQNENSEYTIGNKVFNIYVSGIDVFGKISNVSRSDANILVTVNLETHEILLTSIPRDYYVTLHSKRAKDKLTHSGMYGITETVTTVEDLLDIDINYYVRVNFTTLTKLVDTLGGIDVYSDYDFVSKEKVHYKKGYNHLDGAEALSFSRERYSFKDGDNQRVKNQQKVMEAIINKALNSKTILTKYSDILNSLSGSFNTNIDLNEVSNIVKMQLDKMPTWKIKTISLSGSDAERGTYSMGEQLLYVMIPNETSVKEAKDEIKSVMKNK